ncbi:hypothetical protein [Pseudoalteromonas sp. CH_XMU1449-3]|uniref:hypothetical protein n=1 Tax=Pseudoalteromonas sp. CH_XMU1449-3 TaxID=3107774 RepID=UPI00300985E3
MTEEIRAAEAAKILNIGTSTFKRYAKEHKNRDILVVFRYSHKNVTYSKESVLAFKYANKADVS